MKNILFILKISMLGVLVSTLIACGGGATGDSTDTPKPKFSTANHDIYLPEGIQILALPSELDGIYIFDGDDGSDTLQKPRSANLNSSLESVETSERDVAGISMQFSAFNAEATSEEMLMAISSLISTPYTSSFSRKQKVSGDLDAINAQLEITVPTSMKPTEILNEIILLLSDDVSAEQLSPALETELASNRFTMNIGIVYYDANDIMISITLVPSNLSSIYASVVLKITDTGNVLSKGTSMAAGSDSFVALASGGGLADFLFVVDNSGSMSAEQAALSQAADAFIDAVGSSGLDYYMGVITTDSKRLRGNGFTLDPDQFKIDVKPGTSGSGRESGIFFSELALDAVNGTVINAGYPRENASLSIIFLSDEPNQYRGSPSFDPQNNLFLDRSYNVFAIINDDSRISGQYDDLANATNAGFTADIDDTTLFPVIMNNIAQAAGGSSSSFVLTQTAVSSTIEVKVDGLVITSSSINGWTYSASSNSIVFHGDAAPIEGANVAVSYFYGKAIVSNAGDSIGDAASLQGTWVSGCVQSDSGFSSRSEIIFSGGSYSTISRDYNGASCLVLDETVTSSGTFSVGSLITTSSGKSAYKVDVTQLKRDGVEETLSIYDIFRIEGNKLYLGDFGENDDVTNEGDEANRPTKLDFSDFLTKA